MNTSTDIERRREQNRIAQRRFRQRQQQQQNAKEQSQRQVDGRQQVSIRPRVDQHDPGTPVNSATVPDLSTMSSPISSSTTFCQATNYRSNALLDCIASINMDHITLPEQGLSPPDSLPSLIVDSQATGLHYQPYLSGKTHEYDDTNGQGNNRKEEEPAWQSPLYIAAQKGYDRIARTLLQHNANCNVQNADGQSALVVAVIAGHKEIASLLLQHGAQIGLLDFQRRSALHWAVLYRREALLSLLLDHCKEDRLLINGCDSQGQTPLHIAVDEDFEAGVQLLLQFGANVN